MELMIAIAVSMIIMLAVYAVMEMAQKSSNAVVKKTITQQDARSVLDFMATEIRMASYNPANTPATWTNASPLACMPTTAAAPAAYKGIKSATGNGIAVAMDIDGSGVIGNASNEFIIYGYNGTNAITRNVNCGGNSVIMGGAGSGTNVRNAAAGIALFRYFDRLDNDITAAVTANQALIPNIRRILITIVADNEQADPGAAAARRMIHSTSVIVRNHVLSP